MTAATLVIGLTGGIGSGKSAAAASFSRHGVPVVDADIAAREVVAPGSDGLTAVIAVFGDGVMGKGGALDRRRLRARIFADDGLRADLEAILHPRIRAAMATRLAAIDAPYAIAAIPLLVEGGRNPLVDRTLVVDVPEAIQIARTAVRDATGEADVRRIIAAQASRAERREVADDVLSNAGSQGDLRVAVAALHDRYLELALQRRARR